MNIPSGTIFKEYFKNWYNNSAINNTAYSIIINRGWSALIFGFRVSSNYGSFYFINYDTTTDNGVNKPTYPEIELFVVINSGIWIYGDNIPSVW